MITPEVLLYIIGGLLGFLGTAFWFGVNRVFKKIDELVKKVDDAFTTLYKDMYQKDQGTRDLLHGLEVRVTALEERVRGRRVEDRE